VGALLGLHNCTPRYLAQSMNTIGSLTVVCRRQPLDICWRFGSKRLAEGSHFFAGCLIVRRSRLRDARWAQLKASRSSLQ